MQERGKFCFVFAGVLVGAACALAQETPSCVAIPCRPKLVLEIQDLKDWSVVVPPRQRIAFVTPSIDEIVLDVRRSKPGQVLTSKNELVSALTQACEGKQGPLLVVSYGTKMRVMELRPQSPNTVLSSH